VIRHRLNRGGNRQANHALYRIILSRLSSDPETKRYVHRRTQEGKSIAEIVRCLKHAAREVFKHLPHTL
jgi:DNA-binding CsgD family transcriptional regulator